MKRLFASMVILAALAAAVPVQAQYLGALAKAKKTAQGISCDANLKQLGLALEMFRNDHGAYPKADGAAGLQELRDSGISLDSRILGCKSVKYPAPQGKLTETNVAYFYLGGLSPKNPSAMPLAIEKLKNHGNYTFVLYCDGHVSRLNTKSETYLGLLTQFPGLSDSEKDVLRSKLSLFDRLSKGR